jgi:protein TonB
MSFQSLTRSGLGRALAWSLVAHVLLLWPSPYRRQAEEQTTLLTASLRPVVAKREFNNQVPSTAKNSAPLRFRGAKAASGLDLAASAAYSTAPDGARSSDRSPPAALSDDAGDAEGLRGYRLALAREASYHKHYPQQAIDAGWSGVVRIQVTIPPDGMPQQALLGSSGYSSLDGAAEEMLRLAIPTTQIPESVRGKAFSVVLPVVFELPE